MSKEIIPRYTVNASGVDDNFIDLPTVTDEPIPASNTAYRFYFDEHLLPLTPGKYDFKADNRNDKLGMFNGNQVTDLKPDGLHEYSFDFEVVGPTSRKKSFEFYTANIFWEAQNVIDFIMEKKRTKRPIDFVVTDGRAQSIINEKVTINDWNYTQDNDNADDYTFSITLTEYREWHNMEADIDLNHHLILAKYAKGWRS